MKQRNSIPQRQSGRASSLSEGLALFWEELMLSGSQCNINKLISLKWNKRVTRAGRQCLTCSQDTLRDFLVQGTEPSPALATHSWEAFQEKGAIVPDRMHPSPACLFISPTQVGFSACGSTKSFSTNVKCLCALRFPRTDVVEVANYNLGIILPSLLSNRMSG